MYESNVYYSPEKWGLSVVAEIDYSSGSYEFDYRVVWKDDTGKLWTARDSGCSCPTPFDECHSLDDLDVFRWEDIEAEVNRDYREHRTAAEKMAFLAKLRNERRIICPGCERERYVPEDDYLCKPCRAA